MYVPLRVHASEPQAQEFQYTYTLFIPSAAVSLIQFLICSEESIQLFLLLFHNCSFSTFLNCNVGRYLCFLKVLSDRIKMSLSI